MLQVAVIVGSLRKDSFNRKLAYALDKLKHPKLQFSYSKIDTIPLYNQDLDNNLPVSVVKLKQDVADADAVLFVTPEYNRSIPGVLKNVIDWGTRPYGKNVWARKPIAIVGTSPGAIGTAVAQSHLRSIMVSLDAIVIGQPEIYLVYKEGMIDENFIVIEENTRNFLQKFLDQFSTRIEKHKLNQ
ncbi:MAG: NADPH-dependent reductase protein [Gammaproteobacteria bacterium]|jgi:chromate reductase|nr:NADPH-dependent reductase protein [Gammaproteobacteria bacterium]